LREKQEMAFSQVNCLPGIINDISFDIAAKDQRNFFFFFSLEIKNQDGNGQKDGSETE